MTIISWKITRNHKRYVLKCYPLLSVLKVPFGLDLPCKVKL